MYKTRFNLEVYPLVLNKSIAAGAQLSNGFISTRPAFKIQ